MILSRHVPVCTDLLTIGDGALVCKDSYFTCYRAHAGVIRTGRVTIGRNAVVGEMTVLDIDTALGDGAQLGHSSSLYAGAAVPDGEHRHGSPAQRTEVDYRTVEPAVCGAPRRIAYSVLQLLTLLLLYIPLAIGGIALLFTAAPGLEALLGAEPLALTSPTFYLDAVALSAVLFFGTACVGGVVVVVVPRLLARVVEPSRVYRLYGVAWSAHRTVTRLTNSRFYLQLFGDSSYIVHYLRVLGYDLSQIVQTGSNFGTMVKHETPYAVRIGSGTMIADGLSVLDAEFSSTSFRVSPVSIGPRNFLGNNVAYPPGGRTGDNCLLATKVMVPLDGPVREGVGLLGSPCFEIPRTVDRDARFDHLRSGDELRRSLRAKNAHNLRTMGLFLLQRWVHVLGLTLLAMASADLYHSWGAAAFMLFSTLALLFSTVYFSLVERAATGFRSLSPRYCSIYDTYFWRHERYWKLMTPPAVAMVLAGTPFKNVVARLQGVRIGRRVFDDGCVFIEKSLVTVGDGSTLNVASVVQSHSQEDGAFKSDHSTVGGGCTLGVGAFVHYGVTLGEGAELQPDSFLMKGAEVPSHERWGGNPAGEMPAAVAAPAHEEPAIHPVAPQPRDDVPARRPRRRTVTTPAKDPMDLPTEPGRAFWHRMLAAGGNTPVPRWTLDPIPGVAEHESPIPGEILLAARRLAYDLAVPLRTVLLAAHATVLAALTGERDVVTGYVADPVVRPLPCRLTTEPASWRDMVEATRRVDSALRAYAGFPVDDLQRELGLDGPSFETVFGWTGTGDLRENVVLEISFPERDGRRVLHLRYRSEVLDAGSAARIAGYHLTALALIVANPDAEHRGQSLLSPAELRFQLDGLAGPARELPDRRVHELFEQRVRAHPDAVAAVHHDRVWSYRELNARANRLGRALLARGLHREGVVAVVTERNLDWLAAVLAVFKAGGVYLPIEPHFPADRIARTLTRAGCQLVLTEPGSTATLDSALDTLAGVRKLLIDDGYTEGHPATDLGIPVAARQLAYIYFTSGSTGEPKGAMCEHAGMLNHLLAKIEDLGIGNGEVVAQTAPQCFDISLWQLVSALLVGGRTLLVEQEAVLDVERFVDTIDDGHVGVLQVVPSYLEAVLTYLEHRPRPLDHLRCVSATGEALKYELVQRWFAARPGIPLVNAYGLTETSDDTNHEVMHRAPDRARVPLGRPIRNVRASVVDEHLSPVPLGAPGEIVFSGVCVGRGYINDPERTRTAFPTDPRCPGERLYRSGDRGRWLSDGKLEYLGRRDTQVKISGFRIEIGEIENILLRVPGIRDAAVLVAERPDRSRRLVAFHSGRPLTADVLAGRLAQALPLYMVPSAFHHRSDSLPLTPNGKIDRKALTALAAELDVGDDDHDGLVTPTERRLAAAWADVLGVARNGVGRHDHFFDRGGTSLSGVRLAIALDRTVTLPDLVQHPVLADLARLVDSRSGSGLA